MKRSKHNLSYYNLTTMEMGKLVPIGVEEVLPGDTYRHSTSVMLRAEALVRPLMHPMTLHIHSWYVPNRLMFDQWEKLITKPTSDNITVPEITVNQWAKGNLLDYMGVPQGMQSGVTAGVCAFPIRAYNKIYNEYYRDQDVIPAVSDDSVETQRVSWRKDFFTSARTDDILGGGTEIPIPITGSGNVAQQAPVTTAKTENQNISVRSESGTGIRFIKSQGAGTNVQLGDSTTDPQHLLYADVNLNLGTDLSVRVEDWRRAMSIQGLLEKRGRFGSRYTDYLRSLGIRPSDGRIDRPEYLGGGKQQVSFSEVLDTAGEGTKNVGDMAGHGIAGLRTRPYRRFFNEHGIIITVAYLRPKSVYTTSVPPVFFRKKHEDFWHKEYEAWGPEQIYSQRLYAPTANLTTFGYTSRHDDYRRKESHVTGGFRDTEQDAWHLARKFETEPTLSKAFLECQPSNRIFANTNKPEFYGMFNHRIVARRLVSAKARH